MRIFIMCQGEQRRLAHLGYPKQLHPVCGEPILRRTLRLLKEASAPPPIIVGRSDVHLPVTVASPSLLEKYPTRGGLELHDPGTCVLDGMAAVLLGFRGIVDRGMDVPVDWNHVIFLLGDVVWSRAALHRFLQEAQGRTLFAGTSVLTSSEGEVYGCSFDNDRYLRDLLESVPCRRASNGGRLRFPTQQGGHLRRLLWWTVGATTPVSACADYYMPVDDFTMDLDDDDDLKVLPAVEEAIRAEGSAPEEY